MAVNVKGQHKRMKRANHNTFTVVIAQTHKCNKLCKATYKTILNTSKICI